MLFNGVPIKSITRKSMLSATAKKKHAFYRDAQLWLCIGGGLALAGLLLWLEL